MDERERLIDAFAAEFLLPSRASGERLRDVPHEAARSELIRVCAEYRVSWSIATRTMQRQGDRRSFGDPPTDADFLSACGAKPAADVAPRTMAPRWVRACVAALHAGSVTPVRAAEMMRTEVDADELR